MFILNRMEASPPLLGTSNLCSFIFVTSCSVAVCLFVCCIDNVVVVKDFTRKVVRTCRLFIKDVYVLRSGCRCRVKREVLCILWKAGGRCNWTTQEVTLLSALLRGWGCFSSF
ncbi:unnamed protein product [Plutella xylostella]|uniref:(diamondback moth) hypothetical protein n=1 Tax=Plutella xylostella TaxID=51655 RepID=A0A8S4G6U7_PLUXY|nr:unnamed protein product [Plutella xylostella]